MPEFLHHPSSYRDPSGFVFQEKGIYYRQVNQSYAADYALLMDSGLYKALVEKKWLIAHSEIPDLPRLSSDGYKTLKPTQLGLISYPYEWSFEQLRDTALLTLDILSESIQHGMILKDASPYNLQFVQGRPLFIDTLSFEKYDASLPWVAYRQFCECFLFPLFLEHYAGIPLGKMLTAWPDGVPVDIIARLIPWKSRLNPGALMHVHLQNMVRKSGGASRPRQPSFNRQKLQHLIQNLGSIIKGLKTRVPAWSTWNNYYGQTILSRAYLDEKEKLFRQYLDKLPFRTALDLGANDGHFSRILSGTTTADVVSIDADAACINTLYRTVREVDNSNILPLCIDILHPSPGIGFRNKERSSFNDRFRADLVVALALVHHLVFSGSIPLPDIASWLTELTTEWLLIEFVPLADEKVQELIRSKDRHHLPYDALFFEQVFQKYFSLQKKSTIPGTERILYLMKKNQPLHA